MPRSDTSEKRLLLWLVGALAGSLALWGAIALATSDSPAGDPVPLEVLANQITTTTTTAASTTTLGSPASTTPTAATTTTTPAATSTSAATTTTRPATTTTFQPATTTTATVVIIPPITIETTTTSRVPIEPPVTLPTTTTTTTIPETTTTTTTTTTLVPKPGMYVWALEDSRNPLDRPLWQAVVRVEVRNEDRKKLTGAAVTGRWEGSSVAIETSVTASGIATFTLDTEDPRVTFTVTGITHPDYVYAPELNRVTSVIISSPY